MGHIERRLLEAAKLGFKTVIMPAAHSLPTTSRLKALEFVRSVNDRHEFCSQADALPLPRLLLISADTRPLTQPSLSAFKHPVALAQLFACG